MNNLVEAKRAELINKSKSADNYAKNNQAKGKNRYERRLHSKVKKSVKELNSIDMNKLFKDGILDVNLKVEGETDEYTVSLSFSNFLNDLHDQINKGTGKLELRFIIRALLTAFNHNDVYIHCTCPDFKYRFAYWLTINDINYIKGEQTWKGDGGKDGKHWQNKDDTKGRGCKHILLVLANTSWLTRLASVVYNYVNYMEKHYQQMYVDVIYPAIYEREFENPPDEMQLDIFANNEFDDDSNKAWSRDAIDTSNRWAKTKSQFKPGNEYRFRKSETNPNQISMDELENNPTP